MPPVPPFNGQDTVGVWVGGRWYLRNALGIGGPGWPDCSFVYGVATDTALMGEWDGDGVDTVGVWRAAQWLLHDTNEGGSAEISFPYGTAMDTPVVGDWDGDGDDNAGIVRANGGSLEWHLKYEHEGGGADVQFSYGTAGARPVVGDWNADGIDTIGYAELDPDGIHLRWHLRNFNSAGGDSITAFTFALDSDNPVSGDWDNDGQDSVGITRDNGADLQWHLDNDLPPEGMIDYWPLGKAGDTAIVGDLDHDGGLSCENGMPSQSLSPCGNNPLDATSIPERIDGAFSNFDDDGDGPVNEPLPSVAGSSDCDGDGYTGSAEVAIYEGAPQRDQDPCGGNVVPEQPDTADGWPSDVYSLGLSANKITLQDITSFIVPMARLNTSVGQPGYHPRWVLVPNGTIALNDLTAIQFGSTGFPPMLGGVQALNGPPCPWPP